MRRVVRAPVTIVMLPVRLVRALASLRFSTVLAIGTGAAAAFTAAKRLMDRDDAIEELPAGLQEPASRAQSFLVQSRGHLTHAMNEASEERASAEVELHREYLRKAGRLEE